MAQDMVSRAKQKGVAMSKMLCDCGSRLNPPDKKHRNHWCENCGEIKMRKMAMVMEGWNWHFITVEPKPTILERLFCRN